MRTLRRVPYLNLITVPLFLVFLGASSNQAVLVANWGKFPVMVNEKEIVAMQNSSGDSGAFSAMNTAVLSNRPGMEDGQFLDKVHSIMGHNSRLKFLADYLNLGDAIYSPGDMAILLGSWLFPITSCMWLGLALRKLIYAEENY